MLYDFVAIDFETANTRFDSACSIGIAAVKDGQIVDRFYSLINPCCSFNSYNIAIHGICEKDVSDAPTAFRLLMDIEEYFSPHWPIVAHNASFDISCLRESFHINEENIWYIDTMNLCKDIVHAKPSLADCATYFSIDMGTHHNALDDAVTCAKIAQSVVDCDPRNCTTLLELLAKDIGIKRYSMESMAPITPITHMASHKKQAASHHFEHVKISDISASEKEIDPSHPLYGKNIVFTGELIVPRSDAMQMAVDVGAVLKSCISGKTDYLVVGKQDKTIVGDDGMSNKEEKAYELNRLGNADIHILSESEYLSLVNYW